MEKVVEWRTLVGITAGRLPTGAGEPWAGSSPEHPLSWPPPLPSTSRPSIQQVLGDRDYSSIIFLSPGTAE
jgi:hypothetical protein